MPVTSGLYILDANGRKLGHLTPGPFGWHAVAYAGCSETEIEQVMDDVATYFERAMQARARRK